MFIDALTIVSNSVHWIINFQVAPAELEDMLRTMDGVKDVAVIGIPHDK